MYIFLVYMIQVNSDKICLCGLALRGDAALASLLQNRILSGMQTSVALYTVASYQPHEVV